MEHRFSRDFDEAAGAVVQLSNDNGSGPGGSNEKWVLYGYILNIRPWITCDMCEGS